MRQLLGAFFSLITTLIANNILNSLNMTTLTNHNNLINIPESEEEIDECKDYTQEEFETSSLQYDELIDEIF